MRRNKTFHIAAVSLIEIMMIFTIIGIVTGACMSLNKPKTEYMKKIKVYSAYMMLDAAAKNIVQETHIDYTTDANACTQTRDSGSNKPCKDYTNTTYPGLSATLPKMAYRASEVEDSKDPYLNTMTAYATLQKDVQKQQFKYLQGGFCQRLSKTLNIPDTGINCNSASNVGKNQTFGTSVQPALYVPNGMAIYISPVTYEDYRNPSTKIIVSNEKQPTSDSAYSKESALLVADNKCNNIQVSISQLENTNSLAMGDLGQAFYETQNAAMNLYSTCFPSQVSDNSYKYWKKIWERSKEYYEVYVDINGRKINSSDKQNGPDILNVDIFAFKVYRDGMVLPDYASGFPLNYLTAKILVKNGSSYSYLSNEYALQPLGFSRCYANLTGTFSSGHPADYTGICTYANVTRAPLNQCITSTGDAICKSIVNKPSFFIK